MKKGSNNVTRLLDGAKVAYEVFETPEEKLGAQGTAAFLGVEPHRVFKTIVVVRMTPGKKILALVPGDASVDLKALAATLGEKKVSVPPQKEAEALTGLQAGGISPLALIGRGFEVLVDDQAWAYDTIHISAGQRGLNLRLSPDDLLSLTKGRRASFSKPLEEGIP